MDGFESRARAGGCRAVAGVDEAGRGPLAGPVVAAAVILPDRFERGPIRDSKALSPAARERAFSLVLSGAVAWAVGLATPSEIDRHNILRASLLAMRRAVEGLSPRPDFLFVDGTHPVPPSDLPFWRTLRQETIVGGDGTCLSVMAASIVAKVVRDRSMAEYDRLYPGYGFAGHKGYPTREHLRAIALLGPCPIHRRSFRGVAGR